MVSSSPKDTVTFKVNFWADLSNDRTKDKHTKNSRYVSGNST